MNASESSFFDPSSSNTSDVDLGGQENFEESLLFAFKESYLPIHGYFSISVCVFGIVTNIANIIVLTR